MFRVALRASFGFVILSACSGSDGGALAPPRLDAALSDMGAPLDVRDASTAPKDIAVDTALDAPADVATDTPTGCARDEDCVADGGALRCDTATGRCVERATDAHCSAGTLCVGNLCVSGCSASRPCPAGQSCCAGGCVDPLSNVNHCGGCDMRCMVANATQACRNGVCAVGMCAGTFADCDMNPANGCEADTRTSTDHCGRCGNRCEARAHSAATCVSDRCAYACETDFADCDGDPANGCETDTRTSTDHCGRCTNRCAPPSGVGVCAAGVCTVSMCSTGFADCDMNPANGCETDTRTSATHCGSCGNACPSPPNAAPTCVSGGCAVTCLAGFADCNGGSDGCETDTRVSATHCGSCGRACTYPSAAGVCAGSTCALGACVAGRGNCDGDDTNGCETPLTENAAHCGMCGNACASGVCRAGACAAARCDDSVRNGGESDVDCGGVGSCARCGLGRSCEAGGDCASGECAGGLCVDYDGSSCTGTMPVLGLRSGFTMVRAHSTGAAMRGVGSLVGDGSGTLYAHDPYGNGTSGDRVLRIAPDGAVTSFSVPTSLSTCTSQQIARTSGGDLLLWDITGAAILRINSAGASSVFSTVGGIGGGGSCIDSGVQGLFVLPSGAVLASSPLTASLITLNAAGVETGRVMGYPGAFRIAADGSAGYVLVSSNGRILRVNSAGMATTVYPAAPFGGTLALRRDGDGDVVFAVSQMVFAMSPTGADFRVVLGCAGSTITDVIYDRPTGSAAGTSLYVSTLGSTIGASDGDTIWELRR